MTQGRRHVSHNKILNSRLIVTIAVLLDLNENNACDYNILVPKLSSFHWRIYYLPLRILSCSLVHSSRLLTCVSDFHSSFESRKKHNPWKILPRLPSPASSFHFYKQNLTYTYPKLRGQAQISAGKPHYHAKKSLPISLIWTFFFVFSIMCYCVRVVDVNCISHLAIKMRE